MWFVSKDSDYAFTERPEEAKSVRLNDGRTCLVSAPGEIRHALSEAFKYRLRLWDHLLDLMEQSYDSPSDNELSARIRGVQESLAVLTYGVADSDSVKLIKTQAEYRYDQEV